MTSRVQKGGTLFRPVVKSRIRASNSRQASISADRPCNEDDSIISSSPASIPLPITSQRPGSTPESNSQHVLPLVIPSPSRQSPRPPAISSSSFREPQLISVSQTLSSPSFQKSPSASALVTTPTLISTGDRELSRILVPTSKTAAHPSRSSSDIFTTSRILIHPDSEHSESENYDQGVVENNRVGYEGSTIVQKRMKVKDKQVSLTISDDEDPEEYAGKSRASSVSVRRRKSRAPSLPPYDPNADPGEDIDPTTVTMATLCQDTGQGRVSSKAMEIQSNHAAWKSQNKEKRSQMKAMMEAKKYGRVEEEERNGSATQSDGNPIVTSSAPATSIAANDVTGDSFDYTQDMETSRFNVQVRIGPNGETIIDEESLVVDRTEEEDTTNYTHVVESDNTKFVNSGTYAKRFRGSRWSAEETERFYDALSQYGENYELIAYVLPGRDRKSCKNKFKIEDKRNHARIEYCLNNSTPVDIKTLSQMTGKDFSGPVPEIAPRNILPQEDDLAPAGETRALEPPKKVRKRSRSHNVNDGVVIIGDADTFPS